MTNKELIHKLIINKIDGGTINIQCTCGWIMKYEETIGKWTSQSAIDYHKEHIIKISKNA